MQNAEAKLTLIEKLAKIRAMSDAVSKEKQGYGYSYADITDILAKVTTGMKKYSVSLIPQIVPNTAVVTQNVTKNTKVDKTGRAYENTTTEMLVKADMIFKWVNDENTNDFIKVPWFVTGAQNDPSQAFGSGLTYCTRYFLTSFFQIAQADSDVDAYRSKQKEAEASEGKAIAEGVISQFDTLVKAYLSDNPNKQEEVKKFISRYVKNANYFAIKEPNLAAKLLNDFKTNYIEED